MNTISRLPFLLFILTITGTGNGIASGPSGQGARTDVRVLSLREAVQTAWNHSPEMLTAQAQARRAGHAVRESRSMNLPQVVTGTGVAYNNGFPLSIEGAAPSIFQVGLSQSVLSRRNKNLIREAEAAGEASSFNSASTRNELAARTALAYFRLHQAHRMTAIASARLAAAQEYLDMTRGLSSEGRIRPVDVHSAESALSSAKQQLLVVEEEARIAETELRLCTGIPEDVSIEVREPGIRFPYVGEDAGALVRQTLENSPEVRQAEADLRAKEFHIEAEKGERLPELKLVGQYALLSRDNNYEDYFNRFERHNYLIGFSLKIPVLDGFRASSRIAQSLEEATEARHRIEQLKAELNLATQKGLSALKIARGATKHAQQEVDAVRESVRIDETLLESGRISRREFEETRALLFQKEFAHLEAEQALFQRELELLNITGDLASVFQ